jgi:hypothetical protein
VLTGFAARLFLPITLTNVFTHSRLWIPELVVLIIGAITLVISFARSENKPFLPSVVIAYTFFLPISASGFGLGSGLEGLWPQGALVAAVHFALASIFGLGTLFLLRLRPSKWGIVISLIALVLFAGVLYRLMGAGIPSGQAASIATSTPAFESTELPAASPTRSLPTPTKNSPSPSATVAATKALLGTAVPLTVAVTLPVTETPTITMTIEPTPIFGQVSAREGGGANLREVPNGTLLRTLNNGTIVEVSSEFRLVNGVTWVKVAVTLNGERVEGWLLESTVTYATPAPNFEASATPSIGLLTVVP